MKKNIKYILGVFIVLLLTITSCTQETFTMGDLNAPSNVVITAEVLGKDATHPDGDGSGKVKFSITGDNALACKIDYDSNTAESFEFLPSGSVTKTYSESTGVHTYRATVVVSGKGGTSTNLTKEVTVRYDYYVDPAIVTALTNNASKTWVVDASVSGHFGVGPNTGDGSTKPVWWSADPYAKATEAPCFYSASFTFAKIIASGTYSLQVTTPDGAFTKTGALAGGLPGIPASGPEGCYSYAGGTSGFSFSGSSSTVPAATPSTKVAIKLAGVNTFIGYGATQKEYEIMSITPTAMYLRAQGTETGNAWYLKMIPKP